MENDLQLRGSYESSPPCTRSPVWFSTRHPAVFSILLVLKIETWSTRLVQKQFNSCDFPTHFGFTVELGSPNKLIAVFYFHITVLYCHSHRLRQLNVAGQASGRPPQRSAAAPTSLHVSREKPVMPNLGIH